jgi:hypothetical protein
MPSLSAGVELPRALSGPPASNCALWREPSDGRGLTLLGNESLSFGAIRRRLSVPFLPWVC